MGARYFDLRPGKHNDEYWIYHGDFLMTPLQQTIDDVKQFMNNTQEIVLLHFKEFPHGKRASMAELTMSVHGVISHAVAEAFGMEHTSLRQMASSIAPHVTQWYNEFFYENASIIAVDYLNSTGIVE
ncbi:hypothetical protein PV327_011607, partial [Microctonus hyperodae]